MQIHPELQNYLSFLHYGSFAYYTVQDNNLNTLNLKYSKLDIIYHKIYNHICNPKLTFAVEKSTLPKYSDFLQQNNESTIFDVNTIVQFIKI